MCCVGSSLCDRLITRSERVLPVTCVWLCVNSDVKNKHSYSPYAVLHHRKYVWCLILDRAGLAQFVCWLGYRLDIREITVRIPTGAKDLSFHQNFHTCPAPPWASYSKGTGGRFSKGQSGRGVTLAIHSYLMPRLQYTSILACFHSGHTAKFNFAMSFRAWTKIRRFLPVFRRSHSPKFFSLFIFSPT